MHRRRRPDLADGVFGFFCLAGVAGVWVEGGPLAALGLSAVVLLVAWLVFAR